MTLILSMTDYRKRRMPTPGMLDSLTRERDGLRRDHLARVLEARRERDTYHAADRASGAAPVTERHPAGPASDPGRAESPVERMCDWWREHEWVIGILVGCFLAGVAYGIVQTLGPWLAEILR